MEEQIDRVQLSKQEHSLFCVMGQKLTGRATALIIAAVEADAEYFALHDLGFVTVAATTLVSESGSFETIQVGHESASMLH